MHSTNYFNTFIEIAEDSPTDQGEAPPVKGTSLSVANLQFDMLSGAPYAYSSDDVLFGVFAKRQGFPQSELNAARERFFSKGQACFRASPLTKRYGWGVHSDKDGKIAMLCGGICRVQAPSKGWQLGKGQGHAEQTRLVNGGATRVCV